jgi:hypothetical protein
MGRPQHSGIFSPGRTVFSFWQISQAKVFSTIFSSSIGTLTLLFLPGKNKPFRNEGRYATIFLAGDRLNLEVYF